MDILASVTRLVHTPSSVEQDEDGVWCAHAAVAPGVGAHGEGDDPDAALADLHDALTGLLREYDKPNEMTLALDAA